MTGIAETMKNLTIPGMEGKIAGLFKRHFFDHKTAFFTAPAIIVGLILLTMLGGMITGEVHLGDMDFNVSYEDGEVVYGVERVMEELNDATPEELRLLHAAVMTALGMPLFMIFPFVLFFSLLGSLYDDRKDRSYLFWKSMPVSDTAEVLTKFAGSIVMAAGIYLGLLMVLGFAWLIAATFMVWYGGGSAWELVWAPAPLISQPFVVLAHYLVWALWALPILGWLLLVSAYAPKAPFMYAVLPPVVIVTFEEMFWDSNYFAEWLLEHVGPGFGRYMIKIADNGADISHKIDGHMLTIGDAFTIFGQSLTDPQFLTGLAIGSGLIAGAIWLRRYNV